MKIGFFVGSVVIFMSGAFLGGSYGYHLMDEKCGSLVESSAIDNLRHYFEFHDRLYILVENGSTEEVKGALAKRMKFEFHEVKNCVENSCNEFWKEKVNHEWVAKHRSNKAINSQPSAAGTP